MKPPTSATKVVSKLHKFGEAPPGWATIPKTLLSANNISPDTIASTVLEPYQVAAATVHTIEDPVNAHSGDARLIDPVETIPCEANKNMAMLNLTIFNGTSAADGSTAFLLRGDTYATVYTPATISAAHAVTWAGGTARNTYAPYTVNYYCRPVVTFAQVHVFQTGDPHVVSICSYRVPPNALATMYANCPAATNVGVDTLLREARWGTETDLLPGKTALFVSHTTRGTYDRGVWVAVTSDRGETSMLGTAVWLYGLRSTDRVALTYGSHAEYLSAVVSVSPHNASTLAAVAPNSAANDLMLQFSDAKQGVGGDHTIVPASGSSLNVANKVVNKMWYEKGMDTLDNALEAVADIVSRDYGGALNAVRGAIKPWRALQLFNRHYRIHTDKGEVVVPSPFLSLLADLDGTKEQTKPCVPRPLSEKEEVSYETKEALDRAEDAFLEVRHPSTPLPQSNPRMRNVLDTPRDSTLTSQVLPSGKQK